MTIGEQDTDRAAMVEGVARSLLGHGVAVAALDPRGAQPGLMPDEKDAVARAVESRRREFACGRAAARNALARIGVLGQPVRAGADRAPIWPEGSVGSITHTDTLCLAAVGRAGQFQSIGLDLEHSGPLPRDLWDSVLTGAELDRLAQRPRAEQGQIAKLIFAAKECAYKCQYPLTGTVFGFDALEIEFEPGQRIFHAVAASGIGGSAPENRMTGRYVTFMGHVLAAMVLRR